MTVPLQISNPTTPATSACWRLVDGLITEEIGDEVLVLDRTAGRIHQFNHTAAIVWRGLLRAQSADDIAEVIVERYDVPKFRAIKDVTRMIGQMQILKLVTAEAPQPRQPSALEYS